MVGMEIIHYDYDGNHFLPSLTVDLPILRFGNHWHSKTWQAFFGSYCSSFINKEIFCSQQGWFLRRQMYWYNIMPKDGVSPVTIPANAICMYRVQAEGIDIVQSPDDEVCGPYAVGDPVWMKLPGNWYTTKFKCGWVTGVVSQQSVLVDEIPRHVCDIHPALEMGHSPTDESDESSGDKLLMDCISGPPENLTTSLSDDSEARMWCTSHFKGVRGPKGHSHSALCVIKRSGGECSSYHANLQLKRIKVTSSVRGRDSELNQEQMTYKRKRASILPAHLIKLLIFKIFF